MFVAVTELQGLLLFHASCQWLSSLILSKVNIVKQNLEELLFFFTLLSSVTRRKKSRGSGRFFRKITFQVEAVFIAGTDLC